MQGIVKDKQTEAGAYTDALVVPVLPTSTSTPLKGRVAFDTTSGTLQFGNGVVWSGAGTGGAVGGVLTGSLPDPGLASTTVTPGSYTNTNITVGADGRLTAASDGSVPAGTVTNVATGAGLTGGPITSTGTISLADTAVTPGGYGNGTSIPVVTVNAQGMITNINTANTGGWPSSFYYVLGANQMVSNNHSIIWNYSTMQNTGTLTGAVWTCLVDGYYMISFSCTTNSGRGQFEILLNGSYGVGIPIAYCEGGNDTSSIPAMATILQTASVTFFIHLAPTFTIQVDESGGENINVQGSDANGPATVLAITKIG